MDMNRIFSMALNMLVRRLVNLAVGKGIAWASRGRRADAPAPGDAAQQAEARDLARRARQAARLGRRLGP